MQYSYKAMDTNGRVVEGQLQAVNPEDLELRLRRMDLELIRYRRAAPISLFNVRRVNRQEIITFCVYMEQLTRAGVPLLAGLEDLRDSMRQSHLKEVVSSMIEDIEGGKQLSEAMEHFPKVFNSVFVNLIRVGEESGQLDKVFHHLLETLKWQDELVAHTKKLLMYPLFVGTVVLGVISFVMTYLVPQLIMFIEGMDSEIPMHTQALIWVSRGMINYWPYILGIPIFLVVGTLIAARINPKVRYQVDRFKLRIFIVGPIMQKIVLARFASFFALMYAAGITVLDSLRLTQNIVNNKVIEQALREVREHISEGMSISDSFAQSELFPPLVLRMVNIGESTGELDTALLNVSYFYNREVKESIERLQVLIEPAMTLFLGLVLGWVMMSVLGPIYDVMSGIQP